MLLPLLMCSCFFLDCICWIDHLSFVWLIVLDFSSCDFLRSDEVVDIVLVQINFEKMSPARKDYAFHGYGELCNFIYCLLLKTRVTSKLPGIMEWEDYMDVQKLGRFPVAPIDGFLKNYEFGRCWPQERRASS